jgi:hypothetical protein
MAPSASSTSGSSDMVAMPGVASSGVSLNYSSDDTAFMDAKETTEDVQLQSYRSRAPLKADHLERLPRIDASPRGAHMTSSVGAAVRDLEARARDSSQPRSTGATSAKRASTDSVERRFDTKEVASSPDGDPEPERKQAAPASCQTQVRSPDLVRGPRLDQAAAPEACWNFNIVGVIYFPLGSSFYAEVC